LLLSPPFSSVVLVFMSENPKLVHPLTMDDS
jgi:hypothetical protein